MASELWSEEDLIELDYIRAKEIDALVDQNMLSEKCRYETDIHQNLVFKYPEMVLDLTTGPHYPAEPLSFEIVNSTLPRVIIDGLREELRQIVLDDERPDILEQWHQRAQRDTLEPVEFPMTALHLVTATVSRLKDFRMEQKYWRNASGLPPTLVSASAEAIDFDSGSRDSIFDMLGKTPENICNLVPSKFRVLHIEKIVRRDLTQEFQVEADKVRDRLQGFSTTHLRKCIQSNQRYRTKTKEAMIDYLVKPHLTFHGTQRHVVPSIVRHGFLLPGDLNPLNNSQHDIRCGNTYGRGIYSSPSADFALAYSSNDATVTDVSQYDGLKLIVCATTMGVSAQISSDDNWRTKDTPMEGATSHVGYSKMEYIVFDRAQILPCYVIHLDWDKDHEDYFKNLPQNPWTWVAQRKNLTHPKLVTKVLGPGHKQRLKEAKIAKAAKYLGYGFGPASGIKLVIEEIAEVSEDEEDYGDYQRDRVDEAAAGVEGKGFWDWQEEWQDEGFESGGDVTSNDYTEARQAKSHLNKIKYAEKVRKQEEERERKRA